MMSGQGGLLRLRAEDTDDLAILSAAAQDALFKIKDAVFDARGRRFTLAIDRFRWETAGSLGPYERIKAGLSFNGVNAAKSQRVRQDRPEAQAWLLALEFFPDPDPPGGVIRLVLAGGGEIRLTVECIDVALVEVGAVWLTPRKPDHSKDFDGNGS